MSLECTLIVKCADCEAQLAKRSIEYSLDSEDSDVPQAFGFIQSSFNQPSSNKPFLPYFTETKNLQLDLEGNYKCKKCSKKIGCSLESIKKDVYFQALTKKGVKGVFLDNKANLTMVTDEESLPMKINNFPIFFKLSNKPTIFPGLPDTASFHHFFATKLLLKVGPCQKGQECQEYTQESEFSCLFAHKSKKIKTSKADYEKKSQKSPYAEKMDKEEEVGEESRPLSARYRRKENPEEQMEMDPKTSVPNTSRISKEARIPYSRYGESQHSPSTPTFSKFDAPALPTSKFSSSVFIFADKIAEAALFFKEINAAFTLKPQNKIQVNDNHILLFSVPHYSQKCKITFDGTAKDLTLDTEKGHFFFFIAAEQKSWFNTIVSKIAFNNSKSILGASAEIFDELLSFFISSRNALNNSITKFNQGFDSEQSALTHCKLMKDFFRAVLEITFCFDRQDKDSLSLNQFKIEDENAITKTSGIAAFLSNLIPEEAQHAHFSHLDKKKRNRALYSTEILAAIFLYVAFGGHPTVDKEIRSRMSFFAKDVVAERLTFYTLQVMIVQMREELLEHKFAAEIFDNHFLRFLVLMKEKLYNQPGYWDLLFQLISQDYIEIPDEMSVVFEESYEQFLDIFVSEMRRYLTESTTQNTENIDKVLAKILRICPKTRRLYFLQKLGKDFPNSQYVSGQLFKFFNDSMYVDEDVIDLVEVYLPIGMQKSVFDKIVVSFKNLHKLLPKAKENPIICQKIISFCSQQKLEKFLQFVNDFQVHLTEEDNFEILKSILQTSFSFSLDRQSTLETLDGPLSLVINVHFDKFAEENLQKNLELLNTTQKLEFIKSNCEGKENTMGKFSKFVVSKIFEKFPVPSNFDALAEKVETWMLFFSFNFLKKTEKFSIIKQKAKEIVNGLVSLKNPSYTTVHEFVVNQKLNKTEPVLRLALQIKEYNDFKKFSGKLSAGEVRQYNEFKKFSEKMSDEIKEYKDFKKYSEKLSAEEIQEYNDHKKFSEKLSADEIKEYIDFIKFSGKLSTEDTKEYDDFKTFCGKLSADYASWKSSDELLRKFYHYFFHNRNSQEMNPVEKYFQIFLKDPSGWTPFYDIVAALEALPFGNLKKMASLMESRIFVKNWDIYMEKMVEFKRKQLTDQYLQENQANGNQPEEIIQVPNFQITFTFAETLDYFKNAADTYAEMCKAIENRAYSLRFLEELFDQYQQEDFAAEITIMSDHFTKVDSAQTIMYEIMSFFEVLVQRNLLKIIFLCSQACQEIYKTKIQQNNLWIEVQQCNRWLDEIWPQENSMNLVQEANRKIASVKNYFNGLEQCSGMMEVMSRHKDLFFWLNEIQDFGEHVAMLQNNCIDDGVLLKDLEALKYIHEVMIEKPKFPTEMYFSGFRDKMMELFKETQKNNNYIELLGQIRGCGERLTLIKDKFISSTRSPGAEALENLKKMRAADAFFQINEQQKQINAIFVYEQKQYQFKLEELDEMKYLLNTSGENSYEIEVFENGVNELEKVHQTLVNLTAAGYPLQKNNISSFSVFRDFPNLRNYQENFARNEKDWAEQTWSLRKSHYFINFFKMTEISKLIHHMEGNDPEFLLPYLKLLKPDANLKDAETIINSFDQELAVTLSKNKVSMNFSHFLAFAETLEGFFNAKKSLFEMRPVRLFKPVCYEIKAELVPRLIYSQEIPPRIEEVLFCSPETTFEELSCFILRWAKVAPRTGRIFFLIGLHFLKYEFQMKALDLIRELGATEYPLIVVSESAKELLASQICDVKESNLQNVLQQIHNKIQNSQKPKRVQCITSVLPQMGKSSFIMNECIEKGMTYVKVNFRETIDKTALVTKLRHARKNSKSPLAVHIDTTTIISPFSNQILLEMALFNCLKCDDGIFMFEENDMFFIEVMNCLDIILRKRMSAIEIFPVVTLNLENFSTDIISLNSDGKPVKSKNFKLIQTIGVLKRLKTNTLNGKENCDLWNIQGSDASKWPVLDNAIVPAKECLDTIQQFAPVILQENPSFGTINNFVNILWKGIFGFRSFFDNWIKVLVNDPILPTFQKLPASVVTILIETAVKLSRRNLPISAESQKMQSVDSSDESKLVNDFVDQYSCRYKNFVKWTEMSHVMTNFLGNGINVFGMSENELKQRFAPDVFQFLTIEHMRCLNCFPADTQMTDKKLNMAKEQIEKALIELDPLCKKFEGIDPVINLAEVAMTEDTFFKASAILHRLMADIPVILLSETGVGKTFLLEKILHSSGLLCRRIVIHGGYDDKMISNFMEKVLNENQDGTKTTIVFFDEFNTCSSMSILKEIMIDRVFEGLPIPAHFKFVGCCNPYRSKDFASKMKEKDSKLPKKDQNVAESLPSFSKRMMHEINETKLRDPILAQNSNFNKRLTDLVYQVYPFSDSFIDFIYDFGKLDPSDESFTKYVKCMIERNCKKAGEKSSFFKNLSSFDKEQLEKMIVKAHQFIIQKTQEPSSCSLRDVQTCLDVFTFPKYKEDFFERVTRAVSFVYYGRLSLQSREEFVNQVFARRYTFETTIKKLKAEIGEAAKKSWGRKNIALNAALLENLFILYVGILQKIPVLIIGEPGSSKSLSVSLLENAMRATNKDPFFKDNDNLTILTYQCSHISEASGIEDVFRQARTDGLKNPVVLLEEVGLAELSPFLPLKILHKELENRAVSVICLSNYALDSAKMNRFVVCQRNKPEQKDLEETLKNIIPSGPAFSFSHRIEQIVRVYMEIQNNHKGYYGLRDLYAFVKSIANCKDNPEFKISEFVCRNFSGKEKEDMKAILGLFSQKMSIQLSPVSTVESIKSNLADPDGRNLLILTKGNSALNILFQTGLCDKKKTEVIWGSAFANDDSTYSLSLYLKKIRSAMAEGKQLVLTNCSQIYESLFEVLNQHYSVVSSKKFARLAFQKSFTNCFVHDQFRMIIIEQASRKDDLSLPFLNRLEKHTLDFSDILSTRMNNRKFVLEQKMKDMNLDSQSIIGWHKNFLDSMICAHEDKDDNTLIDKLLNISSAECVLLLSSQEHTRNFLRNNYIESFDVFMSCRFNSSSHHFIFTYSAINEERTEKMKSILNNRSKPEQSFSSFSQKSTATTSWAILNLQHTKSSSDFGKFVKSKGENTNWFIVAPIDVPLSVIQYVQNAMSGEFAQYAKKVVIVVSTNRRNSSDQEIIFSKTWDYTFIDSLFSDDKLFNFSLKSLFLTPTSNTSSLQEFIGKIRFTKRDTNEYILKDLLPTVLRRLNFSSISSLEDLKKKHQNISRFIQEMSLKQGNGDVLQEKILDLLETHTPQDSEWYKKIWEISKNNYHGSVQAFYKNYVRNIISDAFAVLLAFIEKDCSVDNFFDQKKLVQQPNLRDIQFIWKAIFDNVGPMHLKSLWEEIVQTKKEVNLVQESRNFPFSRILFETLNSFDFSNEEACKNLRLSPIFGSINGMMLETQEKKETVLRSLFPDLILERFKFQYPKDSKNMDFQMKRFIDIIISLFEQNNDQLISQSQSLLDLICLFLNWFYSSEKKIHSYFKIFIKFSSSNMYQPELVDAGSIYNNLLVDCKEKLLQDQTDTTEHEISRVMSHLEVVFGEDDNNLRLLVVMKAIDKQYVAMRNYFWEDFSNGDQPVTNIRVIQFIKRHQIPESNEILLAILHMDKVITRDTVDQLMDLNFNPEVAATILGTLLQNQDLANIDYFLNVVAQKNDQNLFETCLHIMNKEFDAKNPFLMQYMIEGPISVIKSVLNHKKSLTDIVGKVKKMQSDLTAEEILDALGPAGINNLTIEYALQKAMEEGGLPLVRKFLYIDSPSITAKFQKWRAANLDRVLLIDDKKDYCEPVFGKNLVANIKQKLVSKTANLENSVEKLVYFDLANISESEFVAKDDAVSATFFHEAFDNTTPTWIFQIWLALEVFCEQNPLFKQSIFGQMLTNPQILQNSYLPTMMEDLFAMVKQALKATDPNLTQYICECGYKYTHTNCGRPDQIATCPGCGKQIGGIKHDLVNTSKKLEAVNCPKGYSATQGSIRDPHHVERTMTPKPFKLVRLLIHLCLWISSAKNPNSVIPIIDKDNVNLGGQTAAVFFKNCVIFDWQNLKTLTGLGDHQLGVFVYNVLVKLHGNNGNILTNLNSFDLRNMEFRRSWEERIMQMVRPAFENASNAEQDFEDMRQQQDAQNVPNIPLTFGFDKIPSTTQFAFANPSMWKKKDFKTIDSIFSEFSQLPNEMKEKFPILQVAFSSKKKAIALSHLFDILELGKLLSKYFISSTTLNAVDLTDVTMRSLVNNKDVAERFKMTPLDLNLLAKYFGSFVECFNSIKDEGLNFQCHAVPSMNITIDENKDILFFLPGGAYFDAISYTLYALHNQLIDGFQALDGAKTEDAIALDCFTAQSCIQVNFFDMENFCIMKLANSGASNIGEPFWNSVQRFFCEKFLNGKDRIAGELKATHDVAQEPAKTLEQLLNSVAQSVGRVEIPPETRNALQEGIIPNDLETLDSLSQLAELAFTWIAKLKDMKPDMPVSQFLSDLGQRLTPEQKTVFDDRFILRLCHLLDFYKVLDEIKNVDPTKRLGAKFKLEFDATELKRLKVLDGMMLDVILEKIDHFVGLLDNDAHGNENLKIFDYLGEESFGKDEIPLNEIGWFATFPKDLPLAKVTALRNLVKQKLEAKNPK